MTLEGLELAMKCERQASIKNYYNNRKSKDEDSCFFIRAISQDGLMAGCDKDDEIDAIALAKKYWLKGFLYVEIFCLRNEKFDIIYHGVRWGF